MHGAGMFRMGWGGGGSVLVLNWNLRQNVPCNCSVDSILCKEKRMRTKAGCLHGDGPSLGQKVECTRIAWNN